MRDIESHMRDSGLIVTTDTQELSDTTELQVTFPMGRRPSVKPPDGSRDT